jgi:heme/copper-type cytochrome/quinol oxidase subunit 2
VGVAGFVVLMVLILAVVFFLRFRRRINKATKKKGPRES